MASIILLPVLCCLILTPASAQLPLPLEKSSTESVIHSSQQHGQMYTKKTTAHKDTRQEGL